MSTQARAPLTVLDELLCTAIAIGVVLVALLPAARGMSALGWLPMWLVGMPAMAWWATHGFALPGRAVVIADAAPRGRVASRREAPQARRRNRPARRQDTRRAA